VVVVVLVGVVALVVGLVAVMVAMEVTSEAARAVTEAKRRQARLSDAVCQKTAAVPQGSDGQWSS